MELSRKRRRLNNAVTGSLVELYPLDLQLYTTPPNTKITLIELEDMAIERIKVLKILEQTSFLPCKVYSEEWREAVVSEMKKQGLKAFAKLVTASGMGQTEAELQARRRDHISHYILRMLYCRTEDLRRWFVSRELELFRLRYPYLNKEAVKMFLHHNNLHYTPISESEKAKLHGFLVSSTHSVTPTMVDSLNFFCVPFTEVLDLVKTRKVYLANGYAYVPNSDFISVVINHFRSSLNHALGVYIRNMMNMEEADERVRDLLERLNTVYTRQGYHVGKTKNKTEIQVEELDGLSRSSFPLCMRVMHEGIRATHHAKHGTRLEYGLFLKGIGLSMESSMNFFREEMTKNITLDQFEKKYAYNIRYNYGKEGKRTDFSPYSCIKIITANVSNGDCNGCPYKNSDAANLKRRLLSYNMPTHHVHEIVDLATKGHYQLACGKYFEATHGVALDAGVTHPNQYFEASQELAREKAVSKGDSGTPKLSGKPRPVTTPKPEDLWSGDFDMSAAEAAAVTAVES